MSPFSKRYKKEYALELILISKGDMDSARGLMTAKIGRPENIIYHCQQSIEKSLKAVLCHFELEVPHTHDLEALVTALPKGVIPPEAQSLGSLTQYATIRKYEEGFEVLTHDDFEDCYHLAQKVVSWAESTMKSN